MVTHHRQTSVGDSKQSTEMPEPLYAEPLLTVEEVAIYLRLQPNTVRGMARRGELPVVKVGRRWRFKRSSLDSWLRDKSQPQE